MSVSIPWIECLYLISFLKCISKFNMYLCRSLSFSSIFLMLWSSVPKILPCVASRKINCFIKLNFVSADLITINKPVGVSSGAPTRTYIIDRFTFWNVFSCSEVLFSCICPKYYSTLEPALLVKKTVLMCPEEGIMFAPIWQVIFFNCP